MCAGHSRMCSRRTLCLFCRFPSVSLCPLQYSVPKILASWVSQPLQVCPLAPRDGKRGQDLPPCCGGRKFMRLPTRTIVESLPCLPSFPVLRCLLSTVWQPFVFTYFVHGLLASSGRENLVLVSPSWLEVNVQNRSVFSEPFVKIFANIFTCETQTPIKLYMPFLAGFFLHPLEKSPF